MIRTYKKYIELPDREVQAHCIYAGIAGFNGRGITPNEPPHAELLDVTDGEQSIVDELTNDQLEYLQEDINEDYKEHLYELNNPRERRGLT